MIDSDCATKDNNDFVRNMMKYEPKSTDIDYWINIDALLGLK